MALRLEDDAFLTMLTLVHSDILAHGAADVSLVRCELAWTQVRDATSRLGESVVLRLKPAAAAAVTAASLALAGPAAAAFAPAATAPVHPGVMTYTEGAQCTANFVFTNSRAVYIGQLTPGA